MAELGETNHEDVMRAFFRTKVSDIGRLIRKVMEVINLSTKQTGRPVAELLPEGNRVVIVSPAPLPSVLGLNPKQTALQSAFEYRNLNYQVYGIEFPMISSWTSRPGTIDVVLSLFNATTKVLENAAVDARSKAQRQEPGSQLPQLASLLFKCVKERLDWLSRCA
jgi:nuclear pore complex protein Nup133